MDLELLDWLNIHTFPEEARYKDAEYAQRAYAMYVDGAETKRCNKSCDFCYAACGGHRDFDGLAGIVRSGNLCGKGEYGPKRRHRTSGGECSDLSQRNQTLAEGNCRAAISTPGLF